MVPRKQTYHGERKRIDKETQRQTDKGEKTRTHTHTDHTHTHTHTRTRIHTLMHTHMHTHAHTQTTHTPLNILSKLVNIPVKSPMACHSVYQL